MANEHARQHRIELELVGRRWRAWHQGAVLIAGSREPEFDAARALASKGITGTLVTYAKGSVIARMRIDIGRAAALAVVETTSVGPRFGRYRPFNVEAIHVQKAA